MYSIADILASVFQSAPCDFCPAQDVLTYADPETGRRYCLPCLVTATDKETDAKKETHYASH